MSRPPGLVLLALLLGATRVSAQSAEPAADAVNLSVSDCLGARADEVRALVALELAPRLHLAHDLEGAIEAVVACGTESAQIWLHDAARDATLELEVKLLASPEPARTRLLALAIAELIATSRLERAPPVPAPEPAAAEPAEPDPRHWTLWTAPGLSHAGTPALMLVGAQLGASYALGPAIVFAELDARWGSLPTPPAEIAVQSYSLALGVAPALRLGRFDLGAGPGVRLGYALFSARSREPGLEGRSLSGPWLGPLVLVSAGYRASSTIGLRAGVELGYVVKPVRGLDLDERDLFELGGAWLSASLGVALHLP